MAAADAFTVMLHSTAVRKALSRSDILQQLLCNAAEMLEAPQNRLVTAALQLLAEIVDSHLANDFLGEQAVCHKLFELTTSNRAVVAAEAALTLCSILKARTTPHFWSFERVACILNVSLAGIESRLHRQGVGRFAFRSLSEYSPPIGDSAICTPSRSKVRCASQAVTSELQTAGAILSLVAELLKTDQMTNKLCNGATSVRQLLDLVCAAASGMSEVGRGAAGNIVARVCEHSAESHTELAANEKVLVCCL